MHSNASCKQDNRLNKKAAFEEETIVKALTYFELKLADIFQRLSLDKLYNRV